MGVKRARSAAGPAGGSGRTPGLLDEAALAGAAMAYGLAHRVIPKRFYLSANVVAALASVTGAWRAGASLADCGLGRGTLRRSLGVGAAASAAVSAGVILAAMPVRTRELFSHDRVAGHGDRQAIYEALVRIPVGTALSEEVIFRGAMLGVMRRRHSAAAAITASSLCFGVWHALPALESLRDAAIHRHVSVRAGEAAAIAGAVAVTGAAGACFAALRLWTGSVIAPVMAHAALNATAYLVTRRVGAEGRGAAARPEPGADAASDVP